MNSDTWVVCILRKIIHRRLPEEDPDGSSVISFQISFHHFFMSINYDSTNFHLEMSQFLQFTNPIINGIFLLCPYRTMVSGREKERKKEREGPVDFTTHIVMIQIPVCSSVVILIKKSAPFFHGYNKLEIWCTRAFSVSRFFSVFFFS